MPVPWSDLNCERSMLTSGHVGVTDLPWISPEVSEEETWEEKQRGDFTVVAWLTVTQEFINRHFEV